MYGKKINGNKVQCAGDAILDSELSTTSDNGVKNRVVTTAINQINQHLTANNNSYVASYQNGKYGFIVGNEFLQIGGGKMELDYSNAITLTNNMTSSVNGAIMLSGVLPIDNIHATQLSINGKQVYKSSDPSNRDNYTIHGVCVGDVITFSDFASTGVEMLLVPYK